MKTHTHVIFGVAHAFFYIRNKVTKGVGCGRAASVSSRP